MHVNVRREAFAFTQQPGNKTPPFYFVLLVRESGRH